MSRWKTEEAERTKHRKEREDKLLKQIEAEEDKHRQELLEREKRRQEKVEGTIRKRREAQQRSEKEREEILRRLTAPAPTEKPLYVRIEEKYEKEVTAFEVARREEALATLKERVKPLEFHEMVREHEKKIAERQSKHKSPVVADSAPPTERSSIPRGPAYHRVLEEIQAEKESQRRMEEERKIRRLHGRQYEETVRRLHRDQLSIDEEKRDDIRKRMEFESMPPRDRILEERDKSLQAFKESGKADEATKTIMSSSPRKSDEAASKSSRAAIEAARASAKESANRFLIDQRRERRRAKKRRSHSDSPSGTDLQSPKWKDGRFAPQEASDDDADDAPAPPSGPSMDHEERLIRLRREVGRVTRTVQFDKIEDADESLGPEDDLKLVESVRAKLALLNELKK